MIRSPRMAPTRADGVQFKTSGRRRGRSRVRLSLATALSLLVLVTAGIGWAYFKFNGNIDTFGADGISGNRPAASRDGQNVLVIGSDARTGGNSDLGGGDKADTGRSDTAFLLHVYGDHKHAVAVSIPRDSLVDIPPCRLPDGRWTKPQSKVMFNSAYSVGDTAKGNPACTQNTVEQLTGLRVDHTIVVDFIGFSKLTEVVGGVQVCVPKDIYENDLNPHLATRGRRIFGKGEQTVSGQQALDYVRIRHGIGDGSDIGRIKRQQAFVASLLKKVKSDGLTPTRLLPLANAATQSMTVDPGLGSPDKLVSFAMSMADIDLHNTKFLTVPWRYEGARVAIVEPDAGALWAALKADRTLDGQDAGGKGSGAKDAKQAPGPSPAPSASGPISGKGIDIAVYNGTTVTGLAARATEALKAADFNITRTATARTQDYRTTVIEYGPGRKDQAEAAARLFATTDLRTTTDAGVSVILGQSYAESASGPAAAGPTALPSAVAAEARSGDDDLCTGLSNG